MNQFDFSNNFDKYPIYIQYFDFWNVETYLIYFENKKMEKIKEKQQEQQQ